MIFAIFVGYMWWISPTKEEQEAKASLRLTTGTCNTEAEIDETVTVIHEIVNDLRSLFRG